VNNGVRFRVESDDGPTQLYDADFEARIQTQRTAQPTTHLGRLTGSISTGHRDKENKENDNGASS